MKIPDFYYDIIRMLKIRMDDFCDEKASESEVHHILHLLHLVPTFISEVNKLKNPEEFYRLAEVPGCKYHQEGSALTHTFLVWCSAISRWGIDSVMAKCALLHDVGKIYTWRRKSDGDAEYPYHAKEGAARLSTFIEESDDFFVIKWYVENHIKPLFWKQNGVNTTPPFNDKCTIKNLAQLALCDLEGSKSKVPQTELLEYLKGF